MSNVEDCDFCDRTNFGQRVIRTGDLFTSFVFRPWFRSGHCLVIPNEHREEIADMNSDEMSSILAEVGRLCLKLNEGYGTGMTQKYQPLQTENGIKINHLHLGQVGEDIHFFVSSQKYSR